MIRLTTALGEVAGVRVNCVCPHTVATDAVLRALESRSPAAIAPPPAAIAPPPATILSVDEVGAGVLRLIQDDSLFGRVLVMTGGEEPLLV